ncbi:hypothetical protein AYX14_07125 [Cryptococcus neoformans]|nr:hypothetical protein AYX14_07125 [Cryptococcus neoformans var. grubii]
MSLFLKQALRVMDMEVSSVIVLAISLADGLPSSRILDSSLLMSVPLLAADLAIFSIFLMAFAGLPQ